MHGTERLCVPNLWTYLQQRSLKCSSKVSRCCVKATSSGLRPYTTAAPLRRSSQIRNVFIASTVFLGTFIGYTELTDTRASIHRWLPVLIRTIWPDAEDAHEAGVQILKKLSRLGLNPRERGQPNDAKDLETEVFGYKLVNPLGISSGLDKHGEIPTQLLALGPAIVEIGGVTARRQSGNPKPRVFRIVSQQGMKNRYGLNSDGCELVAARLRQRVREFAYAQGYGSNEKAERFVLDGDAGVPPGSLVKGKLLAVQVAKNESTSDKDIEAITQDYVKATSLLARYADIIVVNVSCPNAPGFRELQKIEPLIKILTSVVGAAASVDRNSRPAVMVKVSPDEDTEEQVASICAAVWASGVDGVVAGNTTLSKPSPLPEGTSLSKDEAAAMEERGGYSGPQLYPRTLSLVKKYRRILDYPLHEHDGSQQTQLQHRKAKCNNLKEASNESNKSSSTSVLARSPQSAPGGTGSDTTPSVSAPHHLEQSFTPTTSAQPTILTPKALFCSGGITTGEQAMEVLNAGASVAQIYTALVYGGVGHITAMKQDMKHIMRTTRESDT